MDVSLATKARAYLPSSEKSLTMTMLYRIGMTIAVLLPPAISGVRNSPVMQSSLVHEKRQNSEK
jgi:hypothetical protein